MANSNGLQDDTYGLQDPDDLLQAQTDAYERAQMNATPMNRASNAGIFAANQFGGGGPAVNKARQVQAAFQDIMSQTNANSDPNEDPLTKSLRQAQAISQGMIGVSPQIALRAQDEAVRLSQAAKQQKLLGLQTDFEQQKLSDEQYSSQIMHNTPHIGYLAQDQGKDENGIPLGYKEVGQFDLTDPGTPAAVKAAMDTAAQNGQQLQFLNVDQLNDSKIKSAAASAQARITAAYQSAQAREYAATQTAQRDSVRGNQAMMENRILTAANLGGTALANIGDLPMGTNSGFFGTQYGASPQASLKDMTMGILRNQLTDETQQRYTAMVTGMYRNLGMIEQQGGLQGGQQFAEQIRSALELRKGDSALDVMTKMADARQILEKGTELYMTSKTLDPDKKALVTQTLDRVRQAIPFTQEDITAFARAAQKDPQLTISQWATTQGIPGSANGPGKPQTYTTPPLGKDSAGIPTKALFDDNGRVTNNGVGQ